MQRKSTDIHVSDHGTIVMLHPHTRRAETWIDENIGPDNGFQPYSPIVVCEHRFAPDIIEGMRADGLNVR